MTAYERFGEFYADVMGDRRTAAERVMKLIRAAKPDAKNVLELGCGTRSILKCLQDVYEVSDWIFRERCFPLHARKHLDQNSSGRILVDFRIDGRFDVICGVFD